MKHSTGKNTSNKLINQQYGPCAQHLGPRELSEEELRQRELEWLLAFDEPPFGIFDIPHSSKAGDYEPPPPKPKPWWIDDPYEDVRSSGENRLCDVCKHIDFTYLLRKKVEYITEESVSLGPLVVIVRKREQCPFCRSVVRSICIAYGDSNADSVPPTAIDGMIVNCSLDNKPGILSGMMSFSYISVSCRS